MSFDCVIIGGGVVGLSVARRLAGDSLRVLLLEREALGREASWAGAGILAPLDPHRADTPARLHARSLGQYESFCAELHDETGIDTEFERCGELQVLLEENEVRIAQSRVRATAEQHTPEGKPLFTVHEADQVSALEPMLATGIRGVLEVAGAAQVRNPRLLHALAASCVKRGVELRQGAEVDGLVVENGKVAAACVGTERIEAGCFILCAGAWSARLHPELEKVMPLIPVRGQMVLMKLPARPFAHVISHGKTYWAPRRDGHMLLGATEEHESGFDKRNTPRGVADLIESGLRLVPGMADAPVVATWAGLRPGTPDNLPFVGPVPGMDGLIAATGHFRTGLTLAPVTADIVRALMRGESYDIDVSCFSPSIDRYHAAQSPA